MLQTSKWVAREIIEVGERAVAGIPNTAPVRVDCGQVWQVLLVLFDYPFI